MLEAVAWRCKRVIPKYLAKFTVKQLYWSLFFNIVADLKLLSSEFCKMCEKNIFVEHFHASVFIKNSRQMKDQL